MTQLIVMCSGSGTRFGNISTHTNKCLLPVDGKPILNHIIDSMTVEDVVIGCKAKYIEQIKRSIKHIKNTVIELDSSSPMETVLNLQKYITQDFYISVSDGFSKNKIDTPTDSTFFTSNITNQVEYNTVESINGNISKIHHFENTKLTTGLTGLFYINNTSWFDYCRTAIESGLTDRNANNFVFDKFIENNYVKEEIIDFNFFNSIEEYLMYAKA